jgi:hypothetical protein
VAEARRSRTTVPNEEANFGVSRGRRVFTLKLSENPYSVWPDEFMAINSDTWRQTKRSGGRVWYYLVIKSEERL